MPLIDVEKQQRIGGHLWNITDLTDEIILNSNQHTPFCLQVKKKIYQLSVSINKNMIQIEDHKTKNEISQYHVDCRSCFVFFL